jgi:hypothetical protein
LVVNENEDAKISIKFIGRPRPNVKLFREEEEILLTTTKFYELIEMEDSVTFIIKSIQATQSGNYYALLKNDLGSTKTNKINITVNSK